MKVAIVTGAGAGIGEMTARMLHARGHLVIAADVSAESLSWTDAVDGVTPFVSDVSREDDNAAMVAAALDQFGRLDVLVLNPGIARRSHGTADDAVEAFDRIMAVNTRGVVLGIWHGAPAIADSGGGAIVVVETDDARHAWLHGIQAIGQGRNDGDAIVYEMFEVR